MTYTYLYKCCNVPIQVSIPTKHDFWRNTRAKIAEQEGLSGNWYNQRTSIGDYLPNELDSTCGEQIKFWYILGGEEAKEGAYPFIALLGMKKYI